MFINVVDRLVFTYLPYDVVFECQKLNLVLFNGTLLVGEVTPVY